MDLASADQHDGGDFDSFFVATEYRSCWPQTMSSSTEEFSLPKDAAPEEAAPSEGTDNSIGSICEIMKNLDFKTQKKSRKHGNQENQENKAPRDQKGARRRSRSFAMGCDFGDTFRNKANSEKYMSLAEATEHFHKDTPVRFPLKPSKVASNENKRSGSWKGQCTLPKSPVLKSQLRIRPINYLSHEVQQELQMQEMKRHKFKAQPLNTVMLKQMKPLKAVQPKPVTTPVPFALTEVKHTRKEPEEENPRFKANAIPKSVHLAPNSSFGNMSNASDTSQSGAGSKLASGNTVYERSLLMQQKKQKLIEKYLEEERKARVFLAKPIPKSVKNASLHRSTDSSLAMHTTKPEPFCLHTEQRMVEHEKKRLEEPEEENPRFNANNITKSVHLAPNSSFGNTSNASDTSQSGSGSKLASGNTVYERSLLMQQKKQKLIEKYLEEERKARVFLAKPIPKSVKNASLHRSTDSSLAMHTTKPEPFSLHAEQRMVEHEKKRLEVSVLRKELAKQRLAEMQAMNFKAQPATVLHKEPFVPKKAEHPTLEVSEIVLNTEVRAKKREEFAQLLKEKDMLVEKCKANKLEQQRLEEEQERARLRKEATFKAQPFRPASPLIVNSSDKPLTVPVSPGIGSKRIANKKH